MPRKRERPRLPAPGETMQTRYLPRDIKGGWHSGTPEGTPEGTLLLGWDATSETLQLWQVRDVGEEGTCMFVGYVRSEP